MNSIEMLPSEENLLTALKANILNSSFNYTGIGVVKSPKYGKIYVQMFIGK